MFQNITRDSFDNQSDEEIEENKKVNAKDVLKGLFAKQNIMLYAVTFLISMVGFDESTLMFNISPFGLAIIAGALSNNRPVGIMYVLSLIGTFIGFGFNSLVTYFITSLVFFALILIVRPKLQENVNEKKKIGGHLFFAVLMVQVVPMFFRDFYVFELLSGIMLGITTLIFYKIFANSITLIIDFGTKRAFTIEEVQKQIGKEEKEKISKSISENAKETKYSYLTKSFKSTDSNISESISSTYEKDFKFDIQFFTQELQTFVALVFLSDGDKIIKPQKLQLEPYFKRFIGKTS